MVALQVDGTLTGSTDVHLIEGDHLVRVDRDSCAQLGFGFTYQGSSNVGLYLNCRSGDSLYSVDVGDNDGALNPAEHALHAIESAWRWR
jgi:hypothetical protein